MQTVNPTVVESMPFTDASNLAQLGPTHERR